MRKDFCDLCEREIMPRDKVKVKIELSNHPEWRGTRRFTLDVHAKCLEKFMPGMMAAIRHIEDRMFVRDKLNQLDGED